MQLLVVLKHPMPHTKFQGHRSFGAAEVFFKVFTIYVQGQPRGIIWTNLVVLRVLYAAYQDISR